MAVKRVSLYFNTDIPLEKKLWEFINEDGRKSHKIKRVLEDAIYSKTYKSINNIDSNIEKNIVQNNKIDYDEIDYDEINDIDL